MQVLIVGAGTLGPAAAQGAQQAGHQVTVLKQAALTQPRHTHGR